MTITITTPGQGATGPQWEPQVGDFTKKFLETNTLPDAEMQVVLTEATEILGHCVSPAKADGHAVVLVVGYVQSGKTLSFTTLASLARDNGFGVVVLLAGTTNNLKGQNQQRLERDLGLDSLQRTWTEIFDNPDVGGPTLPKMQSALKGWRRRQQGKTKEEKPALVVSVLKHAGRISKAAKALAKLDLSGVPVLIIDDESDQASPNTRARQNLQAGANDESPTYASILELRKALPHHSFVQYTATPQANLLIATTDRLNPGYAKVLSSGTGYMGGKVFFQDRVKELIRIVPDSEMFDPRRPLQEPPDGLQEALRVFLLGIADTNLKEINENRSMMVQAHQQTGPHGTYAAWIRAMLIDWQKGLDAGGAKAKEILDDFRPAYQELGRTVANLATFDDLMLNVPERAEELRVVEVNSTPQAEKLIRWTSAHNWLLIGGQKLDRGFTVKGLTVTYMPRQMSDNADVLQQRARFFGYRGSHIDYCRVYLLQTAKEAFVDYVDDEEFLRASLKTHEGRPLSDWKRDFILHSQFYQPTRANVVGRGVSRRRLGRVWEWPKSMHLDEEVRAANNRLFNDAFDRYRPTAADASTLPGAIDRRPTSDRHLVQTGVPLDQALDFLMQVRLSAREDSLLLNTATMRLARAMKEQGPNDPATAAFVFMGGLIVPKGPGRQLSVVRQNLHVGMSPQGATGPQIVYSGDATMRSENEFTIQLRKLRLNDPPPQGEDYSAVPWLAISVPQGLTHDYFIEQ